MTGYRSGRSFSRPVTRTWNAGVSTSTSSRLARPLSRQIDSVAESLPVYGHAEQLAEARDLRLPAPSGHPLGDVEDDVDVRRRQRARELGRRLERDDDVPVALDGAA